MADVPNTSFIPKQSMGSVAQRAPKRKRTFNVFNFVATVIFLGALLLSIGVFVYQQQMQSVLVSSEQKLTELKKTFSEGDIQSLQELDRRIRTADMLLSQHISPTVVFDMLERRTQKEVQFTAMQYVQSDDGRLAVALDGFAPRFNTIALQSQEFFEDSIFSQTMFSDINILINDAEAEQFSDDRVTFTISALVDTDLVRYEVAPELIFEETTEGEVGDITGDGEQAEGLDTSLDPFDIDSEDLDTALDPFDIDADFDEIDDAFNDLNI